MVMIPHFLQFFFPLQGDAKFQAQDRLVVDFSSNRNVLFDSEGLKVFSAEDGGIEKV